MKISDLDTELQRARFKLGLMKGSPVATPEDIEHLEFEVSLLERQAFAARAANDNAIRINAA